MERAGQVLAKADADPKSTPQIAVGKMLSHYRLEGPLGTGEVATVFRAYDTRMERKVALKILKAPFKETGVARFVQEARCRARLSHPAIAQIHQIATNPIPFIAMEWVDGTNLDVYLRNNALSLGPTIKLMAQAAEVLSVIHSANIAHRDLKPSSLMVDRSGKIHLMDLGVAKLLELEGGLSKSGEVLGTPSYAAPEQVDASVFGPPDHQTDIYALGILLYQSLAGRFPYQTRPLSALLYDVLFKEPDPPGSGWPELDSICLRAIAKAKSQRYGCMDKFRFDLLELLEKTTRLAS